MREMSALGTSLFGNCFRNMIQRYRTITGAYQRYKEDYGKISEILPHIAHMRLDCCIISGCGDVNTC